MLWLLTAVRFRGDKIAKQIKIFTKSYYDCFIIIITTPSKDQEMSAQ